MLDLSFQEWKKAAAELSFRHQVFIDGKFVDSASGRTFASINPATGAVLADIAEGDAEDVDRAVAAARASFEGGAWSRMAPMDRKAILLKLAELIRENLTEMALLDSLDMGKLVQDADGVLNVVPGYGHTAGKALGLHMDVDCIAFTGSTPVGKLFQQYAGQSNMKQVWLETGGKSPNLVFADYADLDAAADMAAFGIFFNQGEVCSANSHRQW